MQVGWPKPGRAVIVLMALNVVAYVIELVLIRANEGTLVYKLALNPSDVLERGHVWQLFTYMWLHKPDATMHLLFNMLMLWMFGSPLEKWWGPKRFTIAYLVFGLGGAAFTLLVALVSRTDVMSPLIGSFWSSQHLGASGAIMGITIAWGLTFANQTINLLFLGEMKGKTFLWIIIAMELLVALSLEPVSSTAHFGGMIAAWVLVRGMWRPSKWKEMFRRADLERQRKKIVSELSVLDGGKNMPKNAPKNPRDWN
jgi:membrane associated rhomboid family serine protease